MGSVKHYINSCNTFQRRINPNNSQAYNKRSSIRAALKDYQGAMEDLKNASEFHHFPQK